MKHFATLCGDAYVLHESTLKILCEYFHYYGRYGPKIEFFALITQKKNMRHNLRHFPMA